jgi:hypothetical protein
MIHGYSIRIANNKSKIILAKFICASLKNIKHVLCNVMKAEEQRVKLSELEIWNLQIPDFQRIKLVTACLLFLNTYLPSTFLLNIPIVNEKDNENHPTTTSASAAKLKKKRIVPDFCHNKTSKYQ